MIPKANWSYPTAIKFGAGRIAELADHCKAVGLKKPLLVTDKALASLPITAQALGILEAAGLGRAVFSEVDPNPNEANMAAGIAVFNAGGHDGVICFGRRLGAGSGQDDRVDGGAGADAFGLGSGGYRRLVYPRRCHKGRADHRRADHRRNRVRGRARRGSDQFPDAQEKDHLHPKLLPSVTICDPELTVGMPRFITAGTGMDALAHCLEAYSSPFYHPMSQGIALEGMRLVFENLPKVYANPNDLEARAHMMSAAAMGAVAFQKGLGAIHSLSHPIGAVYGTHHGTTNAVVMPMVLDYNRDAIEERIEKAAAYIGIKGGFDGFRAAVMALRAELGIPANLTEMGVDPTRLDELTEMALEDPSCGGNPIKMTFDNTRALFAACM